MGSVVLGWRANPGGHDNDAYDHECLLGGACAFRNLEVESVLLSLHGRQGTRAVYSQVEMPCWTRLCTSSTMAAYGGTSSR